MKSFLFAFLTVVLVCMVAETGIAIENSGNSSAKIKPGVVSSVSINMVDDTIMSCSTVLYTPYVPSINGNIIFDLIVANNSEFGIPVWAELYPVIGD